jgi:hypothetical protein
MGKMGFRIPAWEAKAGNVMWIMELSKLADQDDDVDFKCVCMCSLRLLLQMCSHLLMCCYNGIFEVG